MSAREHTASPTPTDHLDPLPIQTDVTTQIGAIHSSTESLHDVLISERPVYNAYLYH
jgi:hypothetical protein